MIAGIAASNHGCRLLLGRSGFLSSFTGGGGGFTSGSGGFTSSSSSVTGSRSACLGGSGTSIGSSLTSGSGGLASLLSCCTGFLGWLLATSSQRQRQRESGKDQFGIHEIST
jgi:hypothetical protein